ncbi:hypothetical protein ACQPU1_13145 [Clostridium paraputrificum]
MESGSESTGSGRSSSKEDGDVVKLKNSIFFTFNKQIYFHI